MNLYCIILKNMQLRFYDVYVFSSTVSDPNEICHCILNAPRNPDIDYCLILIYADYNQFLFNKM